MNLLKFKRKYIAAIGIIFLMAVLLYFYFNDPSDKETVYVSCTFKKLTGLDCAGCGGQRALHHLLHLEIAQAFRNNAALVIMTPYFIVLSFYVIRDFIHGKGYPKNFWFSGKMALILLAMMLVYTVIRNLPYYPFTLPAPRN